jgi:hypothetical protein
MQKKKRCGNCGSFEIAKRPKFGPFAWRDFSSVFVSKPLDIVQCTQCSEEMGTVQDSKKADQAIEETIRKDVSDFIRRVLAREGCLQAELAHRLGITPEYLSTLLSEKTKSVPSFQVYNFLKTMAFDDRAYQIADPRLNVNGLREATA